MIIICLTFLPFSPSMTVPVVLLLKTFRIIYIQINGPYITTLNKCESFVVDPLRSLKSHTNYVSELLSTYKLHIYCAEVSESRKVMSP